MTNGEKALNKAIDQEKSKDERFNQKLQHWDKGLQLLYTVSVLTEHENLAVLFLHG